MLRLVYHGRVHVLQLVAAHGFAVICRIVLLQLILAEVLIVYSADVRVLRDLRRIDYLHGGAVVVGSVTRHFTRVNTLKQLFLQVPWQLVKVLVDLILEMVRGLGAFV